MNRIILIVVGMSLSFGSIWSGFYIGCEFLVGQEQWWEAPFIITWICIFLLGVILVTMSRKICKCKKQTKGGMGIWERYMY